MGNQTLKAYSVDEARARARLEEQERVEAVARREQELAQWKTTISRDDHMKCLELVERFNKALVANPSRGRIVMETYEVSDMTLKCFQDTVTEAGHRKPERRGLDIECLL